MVDLSRISELFSPVHVQENAQVTIDQGGRLIVLQQVKEDRNRLERASKKLEVRHGNIIATMSRHLRDLYMGVAQ